MGTDTATVHFKSEESMTNTPKVALALSIIWSMGVAAPIVKSGACPDLLPLRETRPTTETWNRFPQKPSPSTSYKVGTIQTPLTPEQTINCIKTPVGLKAEIWASEKNPGGIAYPMHFTFDERGRMWMVEPRSYPNTIRTASGSITDDKWVGGTDRILILEDTDGDRVMDKVTVFKDGLNMPQSIEYVTGGVVIAMVPYVAFIPNNNDVAGTPVILWSGMGGGNGNHDTHGSTSSLTYGLDNWIYGHTGYNACNAGGVDCSGGRVWRFRHTAIGSKKTEFQMWTTGPSNAWGMGQMEDGQIFQSGATGSSHSNHSIRRGISAIDIRTDPTQNAEPGSNSWFYPLTGDRYLWEGSTGTESHGWFNSQTTAVSGFQFYTSRLFPKKYWNRFAFNCEGASKLCNQDSMVLSGSTWRAVRMPGPDRSNILASTDAWVAPLLAKTGPDGAVWVLDWYSYLFLHNAMPAENGSTNGAGSAWNNPLRTKTQYRIYRVTPEDGSREPVLNLTNATVAQLVATLSNPNFLWRLHAQRMLIAKGFTTEMGTLLETILTTSKNVDEVGNDPQVTHAIWTLSGLGQLDSDAARWNPILSKLLLHPAWCVRENVLKALPRTTASAQLISDQCSVNDTHAHVRLQAMVAFSETTAKPADVKAMFTTYQNTDSHSKSAFTASGLTAAATKPCEPLLDAVVAVNPQSAKQAQPRSDLHFTVRGQGFTLTSNKQLNSGELSVFDPSGRLAFHSTYDSNQDKWSQTNAEGLKAPVYVYQFRGVDGNSQRGTFSLVSGL
jgi:uncharacterized protein